jgi:hypothetical protein
VNADELRRSLEEAAGPERTPTAGDRDAVRRRARRGRTRRAAWVTALVVVLVAATTVSVRALDSSSSPEVVAPGGSSAPSWPAFCRQAATIESAAEDTTAADASLARFHRRYDRLVDLAPTRSLRDAMATARPYVEVRPQVPPTSVRPALRRLDRALATHCGRSFLDVFKIRYAFLPAPGVDDRVTPIDLAGLQPSEVLASGDAAWLMVPRSPPGWQGGCDLGRVDPVTNAITTSPLPACGFNGVVGDDGSLYFESDTAVPSFTHEIRILVVDPATRTGRVLDPIALQVEGSSIAHTQLAYADGSLWVWGLTTGDGELHRVSPATGEVERVITDVPQIGGIEPLMAATPGQLWLSGGPGGGTTLARLDTASGAVAFGPTLDPNPGTIPWMTSHGDELLVGVSSTSPSAGAPRSHKTLAVGPDGSILRASDAGGTALAASDAASWLLGSAESCALVPLSTVDPNTLVATEVYSFSGSTSSCVGGGTRQLAAVGASAYVLDQGLYRVTP